MSKALMRTLAIFLAFALIGAACGDDDDTTSGDDSTETPSDGEDTPPPGSGDELVIGRVLPETGGLAELGPPMLEGVKLAAEDVNAAGGNVRLLNADSATDPAVAGEATNRLLGEGAQVFVGAAASGVTSQGVLPILKQNNIANCSPSATSTDLTSDENNDFFFRTVPPDAAVAPIIGDLVIADGASKVAIVSRSDDYGEALASLVKENVDAAGVESEIVSYDPAAPSTQDVVNSVNSFGPDAVVMISFSEGLPIIQGLLEVGISAAAMYGADGIFLPDLNTQVNPGDPNALDGMTLIGASGDEAFNDRLGPLTNNNLIYGGQAYDCIVMLALAVQQAGSTDGAAIKAAAIAVSKDGEKCTSYEACSALLVDGADIDYDGVAGPIELDDNGDPTLGRYAIGQFQDGEFTIVDSQDIDLTTLN